MNKMLIAVLTTAVLGAAAVLAADKPQRSGPCAADAEKFCKDVQPGKGRVKACLAEHKKELSEACAQRAERRSERKAKRSAGGAKACAADVQALCKDVKPGEGRIKACLRQQQDKLSEGCARRQKLKGGDREKPENTEKKV